MKRLGFVLAALVAATPALAHAGPFDGTWKIDLAKSKFTGDTFSYTRTAKGFRFSNGGPVAYDFAIDGKDYATIPGRTTAWSEAPGGGWDIVNKAGDKVIDKTHRTLSTDGKTMTSAYEEFRPDGTTGHESDVYTRLSGDKGLAGKWQDVKVQATDMTMTIASPGPGKVVMEIPSYKERIAASLDGAPAPIQGPTVPPGAMATYKAVDAHKWTYSVTLHGKTYQAGVMTVSADGKTLTDRNWIPGKEAEASVSVYGKL